MAIDDFLKLTNSPPWQFQDIAEHMEVNYLPPATAMIHEELEPNFPIPWLQIKHSKTGSAPEIRSHEGRHRALLAKKLGLKVLPVILVLSTGPEGWEHQRETIDSDPIVKSLTRGDPVWAWSEDHGISTLPPQYMKIVPCDAQGEDLGRQLLRLRMTLDPKS